MLFVVWSLLLGCVAPKVSDSGMGAGSDGSESVSGGCAVVETRTVSFDEDVGGYTAADVVGVVLGTHSKTLTWSSGATTGLTLSLTGATEAVFVDEEVPATGGPTIEIACTDTLQIAMDMQVVTVDGQLNSKPPWSWSPARRSGMKFPCRSTDPTSSFRRATGSRSPTTH